MKTPNLKKIIKNIELGILYHTGILSHHLKKRSHNSAIILAYHRVNTKDYIAKNKLKMPMFVSDETFRLHLEWLICNYRIVKLNDIINRIENQRAWDEPLCAITFDDGWYDNYEHAFPIMKNYQIPSTIFIVGESIGTSEPNCWDLCFEILQNKYRLPKHLTGVEEVDNVMSLNMQNRSENARLVTRNIRKLKAYEFDKVYASLKDYYNKMINASELNKKYKILSWANMREMQEFGVDFGYHSKNHYMLTQIPEDKVRSELLIPHETAKNNGVKIEKIFCYPDGKFNKNVIKMLKELGYKGATSLIQGFNDVRTDPYLLRRFMVHEGSSKTLSHFLYNISPQ